MKPTDVNFQKLTGEWNKHINKKLKNCITKRDEHFLKNV